MLDCSYYFFFFFRFFLLCHLFLFVSSKCEVSGVTQYFLRLKFWRRSSFNPIGFAKLCSFFARFIFFFFLGRTCELDWSANFYLPLRCHGERKYSQCFLCDGIFTILFPIQNPKHKLLTDSSKKFDDFNRLSCNHFVRNCSIVLSYEKIFPPVLLDNRF